MKNKKRNMLVTLFVSLFLIFGLIPIHASETEVITTVDRLTQAITEAEDGAVLILDKAFVSNDIQIDVAGKHLTIEGNDVVWSTGGMTFSGSGTITVQNLEIDGAAIESRLITNKMETGTLTLKGITLHNATYGALDVDTKRDAQTEIIDTTISNNTAGSGAAMYLGTQSNVLIQFSTIENNKGTAGGYEAGAIASKGYSANLDIQNTVFRNNINRAPFTGVFGGGGGAMSMHYLTGNVSIDQSYFVGNETNGKDIAPGKTFDGGAIYVFDGRDGATFTINNSTFANNIAYDDGGAIMFQGTGNPGLTTSISNSTFYENKAYGQDGAGYSGGAIQYFKNGGSSRMINDIQGSTFIGNQSGNEASTMEQRGGAIGLSGAGLFATASVSRNNSLFLGNRVYDGNGTLNHLSNYKDISNSQTTQAGTENIINVDKGVEPTAIFEEILGIGGGNLVSNHTNITAGVERIAVPTVPYKPESMADNTYEGSSALLQLDQRQFERNQSQGAVQASWIRYDANGGYYDLAPRDTYDGNTYYEVGPDSKIETYYSLGFIQDLGTILSGASINLTREGYAFTGWSTDANATKSDPRYAQLEAVTYPSVNLVLYAVWDEIIPIQMHTITYADGVSDAVIFEDEHHTVDAGTDTPAFTGLLDREGYTFVGWSPIPSETVTKDQIYTAQWEKNTYTITYESNGGTVVSSETVPYLERFTQPVDPQLEGYTFVGWFSDKELTQNYDFNKRVVADVHVYAKWLVNEEPITMYTIRYEDGTDNEAVFNTQSYTVASGSSTPLFVGTPTREGYTFMGWNPEIQTTVSRNMTYQAQWQMNDGTPNPIDPITPIEPPQPEDSNNSKDELPTTGIATNLSGVILLSAGIVVIGIYSYLRFRHEHTE